MSCSPWQYCEVQVQCYQQGRLCANGSALVINVRVPVVADAGQADPRQQGSLVFSELQDQQSHASVQEFGLKAQCLTPVCGRAEFVMQKR